MAERDRARAPRWMRWALVVSLALNLAVMGMIAGAMLRHGGPGGPGARGHDMAGGPLTRALAREDRRAIWTNMQREGRAQGLRPGPNDMTALLDDLRRVPFDPARVATHLAAQRTAMQDRFTVGQRLLLEHLSTMSDADRAAYADRVEAAMARHGRARR